MFRTNLEEISQARAPAVVCCLGSGAERLRSLWYPEVIEQLVDSPGAVCHRDHRKRPAAWWGLGWSGVASLM